MTITTITGNYKSISMHVGNRREGAGTIWMQPREAGNRESADCVVAD